MSHTISLHGFIDELAASPVHCEHVKVDLADLRIKVASNGRASRYVGLHDVSDNLDGVGILENVGILMGGLDDLVPLADASAQKTTGARKSGAKTYSTIR